MTQTMQDGIILSLYGLGTVFASLVTFSALVLLMRRLMCRTDGQETAGDDGRGPQG